MNENDSKFLVFRIGDELYSSPLLSIREVLEYQKPKPMPNMVNYFVGVINVRGAIVGVLDLRIKFNTKSSIDTKTTMLLCDTERGSIAAIVDYVESVQEFRDEDLERQPSVKSKVSTEYLIGVAKRENDLVTVIDLHQALTYEEFKVA